MRRRRREEEQEEGGGDVALSVREFDLERECHTETEKRVKVGAVVGS